MKVTNLSESMGGWRGVGGGGGWVGVKVEEEGGEMEGDGERA